MKYILTIFLISFSSAHAANFEDLLEQLSDHLSNRERLTAAELSTLESDIVDQAPDLAKDIRLVTKAFDVVSKYDKSNQPLFLNKETTGGFPRNDRSGKELEHVIFQLQQAIIDQAYHIKQIRDHYRELDSRSFACADFFPGKVSPPTNPRKVYQIKIDASQIPPSGSPLTTDDSAARRCTGWYVAPGSIAELKVPAAIVNKGYAIRVGAHSWDLKKKPVIKRLDRVSIVYPVEQDRILIAHPLGGGIYLEVPPEADAGVCDLYARNIVEAPFYSARSFHKTTLQEWKAERAKPAPWTDFESDKFMMQVPTSWISRFDSPDSLTADYDKCMDLVSEITGRSKVRSKVVLYHQIDVIMRGSAFFPGYPHSNTNWNPLEKENGNKDHWFLQGPQFARHELFHEMGHMERITKFQGETEALVNFLYVYVHNQGFNVDLDIAFSRSMGRGDKISIERAAVDRMITESFRTGKPRNTTNRPGDEVKYQHRGYGHYADMAKLFGWEPLLHFAALDQANFREGSKDFPTDVNKDPTDNRILRFSKATGFDLRPLFEFWGIYPDDESSLARDIRKNNLKPSPEIYQRLKHYRTLIPMNAGDFAKHALTMYPRCESPGRNLMERNSLFGHGFYHKWLSIYKESHGQAATAALDNIIEKHYPGAR